MPKSEERNSGATGETPVLLEAIHLTVETIRRRARVYRNLAVGFSLTAIAIGAAAIILRRWVVLTGLAVLPLAVVGFLLLDGWIVRRWRDQVFLMRDRRGLKIAQLQETMAAFGHLPAGTLRSMLAMLGSEHPKT
jgi:hypothetical protein